MPHGTNSAISIVEYALTNIRLSALNYIHHRWPTYGLSNQTKNIRLNEICSIKTVYFTSQLFHTHPILTRKTTKSRILHNSLTKTLINIWKTKLLRLYAD